MARRQVASGKSCTGQARGCSTGGEKNSRANSKRRDCFINGAMCCSACRAAALGSGGAAVAVGVSTRAGSGLAT